MQETIVALLVIGALGYLGWRLYLKLTTKPDCGPDCGCEPQGLPRSK